MNRMQRNPAMKRYMFRFFSAMGLYVILILSASWIFRHLHPGGAVAYLVAVLPAIPLLAVLVVVGLYLIEETDEFEKTVTIQSMLWGIGGTLALSTVLGFLELYVSIPHLPRYFDFAIFWFLVGISTPIVRLRYR